MWTSLADNKSGKCRVIANKASRENKAVDSMLSTASLNAIMPPRVPVANDCIGVVADLQPYRTGVAITALFLVLQNQPVQFVR